MTYIIERADGEVFKVMNMIDEWGEDTTCLDKAVVCVVEIGDKWFTFRNPQQIVHTVH